MPNATRLLRRGPRVNEAELEAARANTLARMSSIFNSDDEAVEDPVAEAASTPEDPPTATASVDTIAPEPPAPEPAALESGVPDAAPVSTAPQAEDEGPTAPADPIARTDAPAGPVVATASNATTVVDDTPIPMPAPIVVAEQPSIPDPDDAPIPPPAPRPRRPRPSRSVSRATNAPVAVIASCPYCAVLLEPPPEADRRCVRCRRRIVVRRVQGRAVYLTEAALPIFEEERRRIANSGRWTRELQRWLKLAEAVDAPPARIARLERAVLTDAVVADARALYGTTMERLIRAAKRGRRWDEVARLLRDDALARYRMAGSPVPPPDDIAAVQREGALAELRGLGEIAKEAELVSAGCCDSCNAYDGQQFRISRELREGRLPHPDCAKGLCRCRWDLTARDRNLVGTYLRRHARPSRVTPTT